MTAFHHREKTIYKNKNGAIVRTTDYFGSTRYVLLDANGDYVMDLRVPFCVADYL